jgi:predicted transcriptional regulator
LAGVWALSLTAALPQPPLVPQIRDDVRGFGIKFGMKFGIKPPRAQRLVSLISLFQRGERLSIREAAESMQVSARTLERDVDFLKSKGIIRFTGSRKTGHYELTDNGQVLVGQLEKQP